MRVSHHTLVKCVSLFQSQLLEFLVKIFIQLKWVFSGQADQLTGSFEPATLMELDPSVISEQPLTERSISPVYLPLTVYG